MWQKKCGKKEEFSKLSLSHQTITRRIDEIGKSIEEELESRAAHFKFYSFAIDESTDSTDTAQSATFIRGIDEKCKISQRIWPPYYH